VGDVLLVSQPAVRAYDSVGRKSYQLPGQETGVMMVYQVFEKSQLWHDYGSAAANKSTR
jgi:hypothetical protein